MLAQAQETIWFKALKTNLKDSVISKLSYQVSDYFLKSWSIANKTLTFDQMWCDYLSLKGIHFEAAAYYRSALSSNNAGKYGDAICYLRFANDLLKRVKSLHIDNVNMFEDVVRLENVIRNTLKKSERENDLIYLQQVPSLSQVPKLPKAVMVKPMITSELEDPITALNTSHDFGSTLFQGLIPFLVIQVSNSFQKRGEEFLTSNFEKPFQELDKNIDQSLSDLNIQSQIDAILKPQSIPNSILENYDRLKAVDGINYLNGLSLELNNLKLKSQQGVDHLLNQIAKEKAQDSELRQFYGTRQWKVSIDRLIELDNKVKVMRDYLIQSKSGDETIFRQIQELKPFLELYKSHERLSEYIPTADIVELNPDIKNIIFKLNEQIKTLNDLKVERSNYLELLRNKFNKIEVLPKLTREYHNQMSKNKTITTDELESVVQTELETFNSDLKYLSLTKSTQVELTNNLYNSCSSFEQYKHHLKISRKREEALKVLNDTTNGFFEVVGNLKQGHQFYSQLLEGLNEIQKDLDAFLQSLEIEKNLIISKLESDNSN
ncbi:hypothetical protein CANARDRAFT_174680 [[Candida] arabinofermentans NRRL YB-2248]|uniref:BRO1 domain-containing protein n=1 Tax=[Candida] arabinofermentans NRRL YB-2248 TaxID=983967 RepID=A0A1E4T4F1_9ASCO|nr:hypothetical protein CANARDRAFT_174680 [[Candida] arabinofermentans NRRL YB-2248]